HDLQLKQHLLWYLRRRDAGNERERHAAELTRVVNELEAENAQARSLESRLESARSAHYQAGDAMNAAQAALYAANSEVAKHESDLRHAEETRQRLEKQDTERRAQVGAWREQRSQLTQALHMWAARAGTAKQGVADTRARQEAESARLPQSEEAFRGEQERLAEARSQLIQAESRLQLEQANRTHLQRAAEALAQRRERLQAELRALSEPDAAVLAEMRLRLEEVDRALGEAQARLDAVQAECATLSEASERAAEALGAAERDHAAAQAQLATLRQIQAETENNVPLREWLERQGLGAAARLWQKLRIDAGWETAVEAVLRERLHALEGEAIDRELGERPPAKASIFQAAGTAEPAAADGVPLAAKVHVLDDAIRGALADW